MRFCLFMVVALAAFSGFAEPAAALSDDAKREFDAAFEGMISDLSSRQKTLHYVSVAEKIGDHEAAVPPLERLLMANPEQPDVMVRIGYNYYHLKSYAMAKKYLQDALAMKQISPPAKKQALALIEDMKWKVY